MTATCGTAQATVQQRGQVTEPKIKDQEQHDQESRRAGLLLSDVLPDRLALQGIQVYREGITGCKGIQREPAVHRAAYPGGIDQGRGFTDHLAYGKDDTGGDPRESGWQQHTGDRLELGGAQRGAGLSQVVGNAAQGVFGDSEQERQIENGYGKRSGEAGESET